MQVDIKKWNRNGIVVQSRCENRAHRQNKLQSLCKMSQVIVHRTAYQSVADLAGTTPSNLVVLLLR